jgi:hypothetical protein
LSDVERVREEMRRMALGARRENWELWVHRTLTDWVPRLKRAAAAKTAPKRPRRLPREIMQHDERALEAIIKYSPSKSNVEIGNYLGCDGGRVSECMRAARADGRASFAEGLKHLQGVVRPAFDRGDRLPYVHWQQAKKT